LLFYSNQSLKHKNKMGRGDIRTKKGKTFAGSFGKTRPAKSAATVKAAAAKKAAETKA
jgi:30S ribosomal protein S31